ncbi:MAG TPA: hypothetical protein VHT91_04280 [Kofleriaceae bacterium]|nr:hypothetical protein [Kofleriaceae bacterium]
MIHRLAATQKSNVPALATTTTTGRCSVIGSSSAMPAVGTITLSANRASAAGRQRRRAAIARTTAPARIAASQVRPTRRAAPQHAGLCDPTEPDHAAAASEATPTSSTSPNAIRPARRAKI